MTHNNTSPDHEYKQGDERPAISSVLHDEEGNVVDLSDAQSATFILQAKDEFQNDSGTLAINQTASIVSATNGEVQYQLQNDDLAVSPGRYYAAWRITWPDAAGDGVADDQWFPRDGLIAVDVEQTPTGSVDPDDAPQDLTVTRLTASEIAGDVASGNVITDLVGGGLTVESGALTAESGGYSSQTTATSAYTASDGEYVYTDASSGAFTITLPSPSQGARVGIEKTDSSSNTVTVAPNSGEQVNYQTSEDLVAQGESIDLQSDGVDWFVL